MVTLRSETPLHMTTSQCVVASKNSEKRRKITYQGHGGLELILIQQVPKSIVAKLLPLFAALS